MTTTRERSYKTIKAQILNAQHAFHMLRVSRHSTNATVNAARRELAKYVHPDINAAKDAGDLMARVNAAHTAITTTRERYIIELNLKPCAACRGKGVTVRQKGFNRVTETICDICHGAGVV